MAKPHTVSVGDWGLAVGAGTGSGLRTESVAAVRTGEDWVTQSEELRITEA